jgi:hypothetical protein
MNTDKLYQAIENMSQKEFKDFIFDYFGEEYFFNEFKDSLVEDDNIEVAYELIKNPNNELEDMILTAKEDIADNCISRHNESLLDYVPRDKQDRFLSLWKQEYDECYFCGDDLECDHFVDDLKEGTKDNE